MASEQPLGVVSLEAAGDLSAKQFLFMEVDSNGQIDATNATTDPTIGVLQDKPAAQGRSGSVATVGISKVVAGAAVAAGAKVMPSAAGKAITYTTSNHCAGLALEAASADGDVIRVLLLPIGID